MESVAGGAVTDLLEECLGIVADTGKTIRLFLVDDGSHQL
jgi:hypothetical protein